MTVMVHLCLMYNLPMIQVLQILHPFLSVYLGCIRTDIFYVSEPGMAEPEDYEIIAGIGNEVFYFFGEPQ